MEIIIGCSKRDTNQVEAEQIQVSNLARRGRVYMAIGGVWADMTFGDAEELIGALRLAMDTNQQRTEQA